MAQGRDPLCVHSSIVIMPTWILTFWPFAPKHLSNFFVTQRNRQKSVSVERISVIGIHRFLSAYLDTQKWKCRKSGVWRCIFSITVISERWWILTRLPQWITMQWQKFNTTASPHHPHERWIQNTAWFGTDEHMWPTTAQIQWPFACIVICISILPVSMLAARYCWGQNICLFFSRLVVFINVHFLQKTAFSHWSRAGLH